MLCVILEYIAHELVIYVKSQVLEDTGRILEGAGHFGHSWAEPWVCVGLPGCASTNHNHYRNNWFGKQVH